MLDYRNPRHWRYAKSRQEAATVLTILSRHIGCGNGISRLGLEQQLDMLPRAIRTHIEALRNDGHAICGTPRDGYFIAQTPFEQEAAA